MLQETLSFTQDSLSRHATAIGDTNPTLIVLTWHGGHEDANASVVQAQRFTPKTGLLVVAPQALLSADDDGIHAHWIHPSGHAIPPLGVPVTTDFGLRLQIRAYLESRFPGVKIFEAAYSGGAQFLQDCAYTEGLGDIPAWALVHNTPQTQLLDDNGTFTSPDILPPLCFILSADDTRAEQTDPHVSFTDAYAIWLDTYGYPDIWNSEAGYPDISLDTYSQISALWMASPCQGNMWYKQNYPSLLILNRLHGGHAWHADGCIDDRIVGFFQRFL